MGSVDRVHDLLPYVPVISVVIGACIAVVTVRRWRHDRRGVLRAESIATHANPNAPAGWQTRVTVRNTGGATAYKTVLWIADHAGKPLTHRYTGVTKLEPGESDVIAADLPYPAGTGLQIPWMGWEDGQGSHERETRYRI
jgi:hypothetical protein